MKCNPGRLLAKPARVLWAAERLRCKRGRCVGGREGARTFSLPAESEEHRASWAGLGDPLPTWVHSPGTSECTVRTGFPGVRDLGWRRSVHGRRRLPGDSAADAERAADHPVSAFHDLHNPSPPLLPSSLPGQGVSPGFATLNGRSEGL